MAMTDLFFALRRFARELRDTNSGDPVTRGELAGFFDALATEGSTVTEVITGNPQELGGEDYRHQDWSSGVEDPGVSDLSGPRDV